MRTLLIDNYDSFTYNLFHLLTEVNGTEPEVVRNDDPHWRPAHLAAFDNIVVSPGPGTPGRTADFGICAETIQRTDLPLLGICLGHQGIGLMHGATVDRAPQPRHGRTSPVLHEGTGLFAGLPSPMEVVRYHSLAVTDLPDELEATAWTPDGILMGLRHRTRPMWGVQFHPESICSEYGKELLANFARLSRTYGAHRAVPAPAPVPAPPVLAPTPAPVPAAPSEPAPTRELRLLTSRVTTDWDTEAVYDRLFRGNDHAYWLDSSRPGADRGRFSVMGDATGPLARVATADVWSRVVTVESRGGDGGLVAGPFMEWLDRDLRSIRTELPTGDEELPFDFALGWVGYLGYELKAECGGDLVHRSPVADATMVFADRALVFDHVTNTTHLLALAEGDDAEARHWLTGTEERLARLAGLRLPAPETAGSGGEIRLRHDRAAYLDLIDTCLEEITAGETYEVCLTNMAESDTTVDPWTAYRAMRRTSPAPFAALLQFGELSVLSSSPERFLRVSRDGLMESSPIKGTRPRGATPEEDAALVADLLSDEKDRSENLMIVDLVRNDLGRCALPGSVEAEDLFRVERYATVHQLVSTVRAWKRPELSALDCVRAAFPGGSMTGAPKIRTMQIIDRLEAGPRGVYSGAIGYFSLSGAADLSIVIRTATITPDRVRYGVGGAVVALSDPHTEYEETAVKAAPFLALTQARFPERQRQTIRS
ncbi:aminodeoxychorismate synthase component I [Streptomyces sp. NBC_01264]|uniref:aminodeoxychorismate synthase component I n=1 Tax=Streptomyces sp. NBC_01264 TaxID=2903804 RepID=UPI00224D5EAE|nr:aminodeoxychorismate synthase component I [Streptomyces sp. NBC_01264]MCX4779703.1 aminodeoxychorismate synthase component I [Streptomyces sp. NBC_01264]